ncbi:uncharacterized protein LOC110457143 [Mizuhopecten yessoensis]|uniref:Uncharacterized protein n=1 Tax=Mizuhopecten yessoensis TaxID=6573 RepID=A0A210R3J8_MIZYE|nr:uncharacterized protein LOC110457143 [Mizuhopecten yessoensis]OWF55650.1 hypothetical protein KP79_PYT00205 [Mizuhopecten yessoensis]
MASWPGIMLAAATLTFIGLFFQVGGFVLPWWFVIGDGVYIGVWYMLNCKSGIVSVRNCSVYSYREDSIVTEYNATAIVSQDYYTGLQVCTTVALGLLLIVALGFICGGCNYCRAKSGYVWGCIFLFLSGILMLTSLGLFSWIYVDTLTNLPSYHLDGRSFPWGVVSAGLGALFALFAGIVLAVLLCRWEYHMYDDDDDDDYDRGQRRVPMSQIDHKRGYDRTGYQNHAYPASGSAYDKPAPQHYYYGSSHRSNQSASTPQYVQAATPYRQTANMYRPIAASTRRDRY